MKFTTALIAISLSLPTALAATITLYGVKYPDPTPAVAIPTLSITMQAIGTDSKGQTTYAEDTIQSVFIVEEAPLNGGFYTANGAVTTNSVSTMTTTYTSGPLTYHATLVQDASHYVYHQDPNPTGDMFQDVGLHDECVFDGKGSGSCVQEIWLGMSDAVTTTRSWTGPMIPVYTLTVANAPNGAMPGMRFVRESSIGWAVFLVGAMSAWVLLL